MTESIFLRYPSVALGRQVQELIKAGAPITIAISGWRRAMLVKCLHELPTPSEITTGVIVKRRGFSYTAAGFLLPTAFVIHFLLIRNGYSLRESALGENLLLQYTKIL